MSKPILLHPEHGVNPFMTFCPRCKGESPEIMLVGKMDSIRSCGGCDVKLIGFTPGQKCPNCGSNGPHGPIERHLRQGERLPGTEPCEACKAELAEWEKIIKGGGLYFRCECGTEGVIKGESEFSKAGRKEHSTPAPELMGVNLDQCPNCEAKVEGEV